MVEIDLDAVAAAEAEQDREQPVVLLGGQKFLLPVSLEWKVISLMQKGEIDEAINLLLGEDQAFDFWAQKPTDKVITALIKSLESTYEVGEPGESSASRDSSRNTSGRSRRTSRGSTA